MLGVGSCQLKFLLASDNVFGVTEVDSTQADFDSLLFLGPALVALQTCQIRSALTPGAGKLLEDHVVAVAEDGAEFRTRQDDFTLAQTGRGGIRLVKLQNQDASRGAALAQTAEGHSGRFTFRTFRLRVNGAIHGREHFRVEAFFEIGNRGFAGNLGNDLEGSVRPVVHFEKDSVVHFGNRLTRFRRGVKSQFNSDVNTGVFRPSRSPEEAENKTDVKYMIMIINLIYILFS